MDLEEPGDTGLQLDLAPGSPSSRAAAADQKNRDPERFYCPFPGCNRSFAELWRLKVHYRAPPDIRGSGKERGHGTELTHCPKCGKTLKPGKHHVGCSGGKAAARQTNKRSRAAGDADQADDALIASPSGKHGRGNDLDVDLHPPGWPADFAQPNAAYAVALQPAHMKLERPEWAAMQPGIIYAQPGGPTHCWIQPGQVNGLVPQMQGHVYHQAQFPAMMQYASGPQGYLQQVPTYAGLAGFPISEQGQIMSLQPGGQLQPHMAGMHGVPHGALPVMGQLMVPHHQHQHHQQQQHHHQHQQHPHGATKQEHEAAGLPPSQADGADQQQPHNHQQQPPGSAVQLHHQQALGMPPHEQQQQQHDQQQPLSEEPAAGGVGGGGLVQEGGGGGGGAGPSDGAGGDGGGAAAAPPAVPTTSCNESPLDSIFGDVEEFTRDFGRIPSPPPLPTDFHSASGGGGGMLFNFGQFNQKLPRSQSHTRLDRNLDRLGIDSSLGADLAYDHQDDGELMQLLFGVPDELPTMATIHLHKWTHDEDDEPGGLDGHDGGPGGSGLAAAGEAARGHAALAGGGQAAAGSNGRTDGGLGAYAHGADAFLAHGGGKAGLTHLVNGMTHQSHPGDDQHRDHLLDAETFRLLQSCD